MIQVRVPEAVYLAVGDSTSARFDGLILEHATGPITMKARWQPVSQMRDVFQNEKISEYLTRILMEMRHVKRTADTRWPFPRLPERIAGGGPEYHYEPRNPERCVMLFEYGESDFFEMSHQYAAETFDYRTAEQAVQERCEPLFNALTTLKAIGYTNVFLHGITPPTRYEVTPFPPYSVRLKLAQAGRDLYERFSRESGVGLISLWDEMFSQEHGRDPRYVRDHVHLNPASAVISAQKLCEQLEKRGYYRSAVGAQPEYPNNSTSCA